MYTGVDGCSKGWFAVWGTDQESARATVFDSLSALWKDLGHSTRILIDIPIGLPSSGQRACDVEARRMLSPKRASCVFPAPCREAVYASSQTEASTINKKILGSGLSSMTWGICPKIREMDELLFELPKARTIFRESHPELCFLGLTDQTPLTHKKKCPAGAVERLSILKPLWPEADKFFGNTRSLFKKARVSDDDIIDAMALFVVAQQPPARLLTVPQSPPNDDRAIPMEMVYAIPTRIADAEATTNAHAQIFTNNCPDELLLYTAFALRFDGYRYCRDTRMDVYSAGPNTLHDATGEFFPKPDFGRNSNYLRMIFFFIQRSFIREGWLREGDALMSIARSIFLMLATEPIPEQYRDDEYDRPWQCKYAPHLESYIAMVREKHDAAIYRAYGEATPPG